MEAIILAGGFGTRLMNIVPDLPKALAPIQGKPFIDYLFEQLKQIGSIKRVILALGYRADQMIFHLDHVSMPFEIDYVIEKRPLGTGGALRQALQATSSSEVLVMNGDSFLSFDFEALQRHHHRVHSSFTIVSKKVEKAHSYGGLTFDPSSYRILSFQEKSVGEGWINAGAYLVEACYFLSASFPLAFSLEKEGFPVLLQKNLFAYPYEGLFLDIGTEERYQQAQHLEELLAWQKF